MTVLQVPVAKKKRPKFNASLSFSHRPPYDALFAERIPVLHAFQYAITNYIIERRSEEITPWQKIKALVGIGRPFRAVECGVYTGSSLIACAKLAKDSGISFEIVGLDTFSGLPALSDKDIELAPPGARYLSDHLFTDTSLNAVQTKVNEAGLQNRVILKAGLFDSTLPTLAENKYDFVNIDCDLYEPHIECLEYFYGRMVRGGVIFFDDYYSVDYPMAKSAIDEFLKDKPEKLCHVRFGDDAANRMKTFVVKY